MEDEACKTVYLASMRSCTNIYSPKHKISKFCRGLIKLAVFMITHFTLESLQFIQLGHSVHRFFIGWTASEVTNQMPLTMHINCNPNKRAI